MSPLPAGTVTFLFTDIEGSTPLWERMPEAMKEALQRHHAILHQAIEEHGGQVFLLVGDAFCAAFRECRQAVKAALSAQQALTAEAWGATGPLRVRMGIHTGPAEPEGPGYLANPTLNRVARIMSAGHGGQVLLSLAASAQLGIDLPGGTQLRDLGEHYLKGLSNPEHLFQILAPGLPTDFPPLKSENKPRHNLPKYLTPFIGREKEIGRVKQLLAEARLVTLTGSGGVGKSRLAIQVGEELYGESRDGVWLAELAPLNDPDMVANALADVFGLLRDHSRPALESLVEFLKPQNLLILLDNCEHLIDACARLSYRLIQACPEVRILASSREALGVDGERAFPVSSLTFPDRHSLPSLEELAEYEAVRMFVLRAQAVLPDFHLTAQNAAGVVQITRRLDGIPLAIELAAARVKMLQVEQIAARLDDSFRLLTGGSRTALPRHQTLRALIDWSYSLLSPPERVLMHRLAVFSGGWTLEMAEAVCADNDRPAEEGGKERIYAYEVMDLLMQLSNKSLVVVEREPGKETRYHFLETIRQYAREKQREAGEVEMIHARHLFSFRDLAERAEPELWRKDQKRWLDRLEGDYDNIRAALEWSTESQNEAEALAGLRLIVALEIFWIVRSQWSEADYLARLLNHPAARTDLRQYGHGLRIYAEFKRRDRAESSLLRNLLEESRSIGVTTGDPALTAHSLRQLARTYYLEGEKSMTLFQESVQILRQAKDTAGLIQVLCDMGFQSVMMNDTRHARVCYEESLQRCRDLGYPFGTAETLLYLGDLDLREDRLAEAETAFAESLQIYQHLDARFGVADILNYLAEIAILNDNLVQADAYIQEMLAVAQAVNDKYHTLFGLAMVAEIQFIQKNFTEAGKMLEEVLRLEKERHYPTVWINAQVYQGLLAIYQGNWPQAQAIFRQVLSNGAQVQGLFPNVAFTFMGLALRADGLGLPAEALRLLVYVEPFLHIIGSPARLMHRKLVEQVIAQLRPEEAAAAREAGRQMQTWKKHAVHEHALRLLEEGFGE